MKEVLLKIWKVVRNKYVLATIIFLLVLLFFDEYNLMDTRRVSKQVNALKAEEKQLRDDMVADSLRAVALRNDLDELERYGRENYYMKRSDEDIYVIKDKRK